jgi:lysophospholipase L1-like esterase
MLSDRDEATWPDQQSAACDRALAKWHQRAAAAGAMRESAGMKRLPSVVAIVTILAAGLTVFARASLPPSQSLPAGEKWVASWAASAHGPYPSGNASAQPVLDYAIESASPGAVDQTFRLIVRPDLWGGRARLRFSNAFGTGPVVFDDVFVGLQGRGGSVVAGTNRRVTFEGERDTVAIPQGASAWSDPVALDFVDRGDRRLLDGRKLAVSFHSKAATGPMTWHAKALQTSYMTAPRAGSHGAEETDAAFRFTTTSWYFLDAVDVTAPSDTVVIACFGDSITDGTGSTLNGDDRWPDVLSGRLHASYGPRVSVVNAGIGGNRVTGPAEYSSQAPFAGGPSALDRLDRDVLSLSGLSAVIWLEGINDLSSGASPEAVIEGLRRGAGRLRERGIRVVGATVTPALGASGAAGAPDVDAARQAINTFIRTSGVFDDVVDFDGATRDPGTGSLRAEFQPGSTIGGPGDKLHPNRAGYQAMAGAIDPGLFDPAILARPAKAR